MQERETNFIQENLLLHMQTAHTYQHQKVGLCLLRQNTRLNFHLQVCQLSLRLMPSWQPCLLSQPQAMGLSGLLCPFLNIRGWTIGSWDQSLMVSFLPEVHEEISKLWKAPFSARTRFAGSSIITTLSGEEAQGTWMFPR